MSAARLTKGMRELFRAIIRPLALAYCGAEYFFSVLCHLSVLRKAEYVAPLWFWSFGHQATDPHMLALRFQGKKLLVLLSDYGNFNRYIVDAFRPHMNIVDLRHARFPLHFLKSLEITWVKNRVLRLVLCLVRSRAQFVATFFERFGPPAEGFYVVEYSNLLSSREPSVIRPITAHVQTLRDILRREHPALAERWFVSLYFRKKQQGAVEVRDMNPETYRAAIEHVHKQGGWVFCGGDYDPRDVFPGMERVLGYRDFPCDRALCDLYFLTQCLFLICGQSGPLAIAIAFSTPTLVTNAALYYITGCRDNQRIIYKKLLERRTGRVLTAQEMFRLPVLCFNSNEQFDRSGFVHADNTPEDLHAAVNEMLELHLFQRDVTLSEEYEELYRRFRALLPVGSMVYETPCKPTLSCLRSLQL